MDTQTTNLTERRQLISNEIARLIEEDIAAALAGGAIVNSDQVLRLTQERNIIDGALERRRRDGH